MKTSDIDEKPILEFLLKLNGKWAHWLGDKYDNSVTHAFPKDVPHKILLSKMRSLIKRGLVDGCDCGCRGDYVITEKGREKLSTSQGV